MSFDDLNDDNFILYLAKSYDKPNMIMSEFREDLKRFNYIKRLFRRYRILGEIKERLIINHLVVIYNVFGVEVSTRALFFRVKAEDYSALKTYLLFLNYMPIIIKGINGRDINSSDILIDDNITEVLKTLK
jgi:5'(3')-deoxyribonucleotidase